MHEEPYLIRCPKDKTSDLMSETASAQKRIEGNEQVRAYIAKTVLQRIMNGVWDYVYYDAGQGLLDEGCFMRAVLHRSAKHGDGLQLTALFYTPENVTVMYHSRVLTVSDLLWETVHLDAKKLWIGVLE